jgi:hypothetical protein
MKKYLYATLTVLLVLLTLATALPSDSSAGNGSEGLRYRVNATSPLKNRLVRGEATSYVQGVPAEPVHSFVWDGVGSEPIMGTAKLDIDPVNNTGKIQATWFDEHGAWKFTQTAFAPPDHPSGLIISASPELTEFIVGDPVPLNVYLHGNTTAGGPVLPAVFNLIATWGPAEVTLNGQPFENTFDGPTPLWVAHTMTTIGVRNDDGTVRNSEGEIFSGGPNAGDGAVDYDDMEFHLVFHDAPGPMTNNFPPPLSFFYHLTFEDVNVKINHSE